MKLLYLGLVITLLNTTLLECTNHNDSIGTRVSKKNKKARLFAAIYHSAQKAQLQFPIGSQKLKLLSQQLEQERQKQYDSLDNEQRDLRQLAALSFIKS